MAEAAQASCAVCKRDLPRSVPRIAVAGGWRCGDCELLAVNPDAAIAEPKRSSGAPATEPRFDARAYTRR